MKSKRHPLLIYELIGSRMRSKLLILVVIFLLAGLVDLAVPIFGTYWYFTWIGFVVTLVLWLYYAFLMRRAAVLVRDDILVIQGPISQLKISYGRIISATSVRLDRHHPHKALTSWQKGILRPLYEQTCLLVDLEGWPKAATAQRIWLPKLLFSQTGPGILCSVEDWIKLSQEIEVARGAWLQRREAHYKADTRSLAAKVMSLDD